MMTRRQQNQSTGTYALPNLAGFGQGLSPELQQVFQAAAQNYSDQRALLEQEAPKRNILGNIALALIAGPGAAMRYDNFKKNQYQQRLAGFDNSYQNAIRTLAQALNQSQSARDAYGNQQAVEKNFAGLTGNTGSLSAPLAQELLRGGSASESTGMLKQAAEQGLGVGAGAGNNQLGNLLAQIGGGKIPQTKTTTPPIKRVETPQAPEQMNTGGFTNQELASNPYGLDLSQPEAAQAGTLNAGVETAQKPQAAYLSPESYKVLADLLGGSANTAFKAMPDYAKTPSEIGKNKAAAAYDMAGVGLRGAQTRQTNEETKFIAPQAKANIAKSYASAGASRASAANYMASANQTNTQTQQLKELHPLNLAKQTQEVAQATQGKYNAQLSNLEASQKAATDALLRIGALNKKTGAINFQFKSKDGSVQKVFADSVRALGDASRGLQQVQAQSKADAWYDAIRGQ